METINIVKNGDLHKIKTFRVFVKHMLLNYKAYFTFRAKWVQRKELNIVQKVLDRYRKKS